MEQQFTRRVLAALANFGFSPVVQELHPMVFRKVRGLLTTGVPEVVLGISSPNPTGWGQTFVGRFIDGSFFYIKRGVLVGDSYQKDTDLLDAVRLNPVNECEVDLDAFVESILNEEDDEIDDLIESILDDLGEDESLDEVLTAQQRRDRKKTMRRLAPKMARERAKKAKRRATRDDLVKRARNRAKKLVMQKLLKGKSLDNLTQADHERLEKKMQKPAIKNRINKIAKKMMKQVKADEKAKWANKNKEK